MKLIVTVDTEADRQKRGDAAVELKNLAALPRFQALCERYGFPPTYLITYEVAAHEETAAYLKEWQEKNQAEVGAHLHPWTTPPASQSDAELSFPSNLSNQDLEQKFTALTEKISSIVGRRPTSYRAGRWGFDARQEALLKNSGYLVDCSITPGVDWRVMGGPDFRNESVIPRKLPSGLIEVPMTILYTGFLRRILRRPLWLRIFPKSSMSDWVSLYRSAERNKLPVLMFMIHSSELHLGTSSLTKTEADVQHMYRALEELLSFLQKKGVSGVTLSGFAKSFV